MEHILILAWLGDQLRDKRINNREHVILDYLGGKSEPVKLAQLKKMPWYMELYRHYSPATESRDWSHLLNKEMVTKLDDGFIELNPFKV